MMRKLNQKQIQLPTKGMKSDAGYKFEMKEETYNEVLQYLQKDDPNLRNYQDMPHTKVSLILRNYSKSYNSIEWKLGLKVSSLPPNNFIKYKESKTSNFGKVCYILDFVNEELHDGPLLVVQFLETVKEQEHDKAKNSFLVSQGLLDRRKEWPGTQESRTHLEGSKRIKEIKQNEFL
ncbi:hypothetical protein O181_027148 [Austropuccinia psidii MF-1]|uniref:Uncharacterized protein n=1 Tax=Austropuccinia psidii MF-1 TaxID=1389203 RepID=A0A9Q3H0N6_9BASI|nr:hypothetical protein [Austropuccinia psidii MF-1]